MGQLNRDGAINPVEEADAVEGSSGDEIFGLACGAGCDAAQFNFWGDEIGQMMNLECLALGESSEGKDNQARWGGWIGRVAE